MDILVYIAIALIGLQIGRTVVMALRRVVGNRNPAIYNKQVRVKAH